VAEVTNELMYEVLKQVQERLGRMDGKMDELKQELISIRVHMVATQNDIANIYTMLGRYDARLERIERRLELVEVP
jgi:hypothetical protein